MQIDTQSFERIGQFRVANYLGLATLSKFPKRKVTKGDARLASAFKRAVELGQLIG